MEKLPFSKSNFKRMPKVKKTGAERCFNPLTADGRYIRHGNLTCVMFRRLQRRQSVTQRSMRRGAPSYTFHGQGL